MSWIWSGLGWGLLAAGLGVLAWALWWDRAGWRGRAGLRCRGCWYDLTGARGLGGVADGEGEQEKRPTVSRPHGGDGVVCPECGKGHRSVRAMRKTRRRWGWVGCALMILAGAHAASSAPGIQKRGWGAAVPGVVLVAWMPLMSEEPGTGLEGMTFGVAGSGSGLPRASGMDRLVIKEVGGEAYLRTVFGDAPGPARLGWISRRLLFLLARTEDIGVMTDSTTAKGRAYKHAISSAVNSGRAWGSEARWAQGVAHIEAEPDRAYGVGELVRGDFRIRRLLLGGYMLSGSIASNLVEYRCGTSNNMIQTGGIPIGTPQEIAEYWIKQFSWDSVFEADRARGRTNPVEKHAFGVAEEDGAGGGSVRLHYGVMVNEVPRGETERLVTVASLERSLPVQIDPERVMVVDTSSPLRAMLESNLRAELIVEYDTTRNAWVPLVRLVWTAGAKTFPELIFGGMVSVDVVRNGMPIDQGQKVLESQNDQSWWKLTGASVNRHRSGLLSRPGRNQHFAGEVQPNRFLPSNRDGTNPRLVVRITPMRGNFTRTYGGLWADRVYDGVLVVPLDDWTIEEVRRYIVSGVVPDHAMP